MECIKKKRKIRLLYKIIALFLVLGGICGGLLAHFKQNVLPKVMTLSEATVKALATNALNDAAQTAIGGKYTYADIVTVEKTAAGEISMLHTNTNVVNTAKRNLAVAGQTNVEGIAEQYLELPLGAFSGSAIFGGTGPKVKIYMLPIGSVYCETVSVFEDAGINQTRHSVFITMTASVSLVLPMNEEAVEVKTAVLLCESIIVGKVPEFYLNSSNSGGFLDLIP